MKIFFNIFLFLIFNLYSFYLDAQLIKTCKRVDIKGGPYFDVQVAFMTGYELIENLNIKEDPLLKIAIELEKIALNDTYFIEKKLYPNVDFYSGIILKAIGFPKSMFTVLFAIGRTIGWVSHWKEMIEDPINKIGRPRQLYNGAKIRDYQQVDTREKKSIFQWLWKK